METEKITIGALLKARNTLWQISQEARLSPRTAYKIVKFCKKTEDEEEFYRTKLQEIIDKYAEKDSNGGNVEADNGGVHLRKECIGLAQTAIKELDELEVDRPHLIIALSELDGVRITPAEMLAIEEFIREESENGD